MTIKSMLLGLCLFSFALANSQDKKSDSQYICTLKEMQHKEEILLALEKRIDQCYSELDSLLNRMIEMKRTCIKAKKEQLEGARPDVEISDQDITSIAAAIDKEIDNFRAQGLTIPFEKVPSAYCGEECSYNMVMYKFMYRKFIFQSMILIGLLEQWEMHFAEFVNYQNAIDFYFKNKK